MICFLKFIFYILRKLEGIIVLSNFYFYLKFSMKDLNAHIFIGKFTLCHQLESIMGTTELVLQVSNLDFIYTHIIKEYSASFTNEGV